MTMAPEAGEASVEGGVDREETVGTTPELPGQGRDIVDRWVEDRAGTMPLNAASPATA